MPFDHSTFETDRHPQLLIESGAEQLGEDMYPERELSGRSPVTSKNGTVSRVPRAYSYGRTDRSAKVGNGDRAVVYSTHLGSLAYVIEHAAAAVDITDVDRVELESMRQGGDLNFLSLIAQRQILTEYAQDWNVIAAGNGTAGDDTLVDVVALPGGDEFNDGSNPSKTFEQYLREAIQFTKGHTLAINEDVLWGVLANPSLAENDLNTRSMTLDEFLSWLNARGINNLIVLKNEGQSQDPRMGLSTDYLHDDVCMVGELALIQYIVMNDLDFYTVRDEMTRTDYMIAFSDYTFRVGFESKIRVFTNTMA